MIRSQKELSEAKHPTEQLSQTDKLVLRYSQSRDWAAENQRTLLFGLLVVVLVIGGIFYLNIQKTKGNDVASTYLSRVMEYYATGDYRHAIDGDKTKRVQGEAIHGLKQIVDDYGSTVSGSEAALMLGNAYYYLGKYDSANAAFDKAITSTPLMAASVEAGHAAILEAKGNKEEAAKLFESAAKRDKNNPRNADYLLDAARDLQQVGKNEDAVRLYKSMLADYPGTEYDDAAKRALLQLKVDI